MADVVESGQGGRAWTGWVAGGAALLALVAGALRGTSGEPAAAPSASPSGSAAPASEPAPATYAPVPTASPAPDLVFTRRWQGRHAPLLLAFGARLIRDHGDDSTDQQVGGIGSPGVRLLPVTGGTVVLDSSGDHEVSGQSVAASFLPSGGLDVVALGDVDGAVPAFEPSSVWLVDGRLEDGEPLRMRRVDVRTGRVRQRATLPDRAYAIAGGPTGLVLRSTDEHPLDAPDWIWDPATRRTVRKLPGLVEQVVGSKAVVRLSRCTTGCIQVRDLETGSTLDARELDAAVTGPLLSPDGNWLAAFVATEGERQHLVVNNLGAGTTFAYDDTEISERTLARLAWARDSNALFVALRASDEEGQILVWDRGSEQVSVLDDESAQEIGTE